MATTGLPPYNVRQYAPTDKSSILNICKTVYGGRDYIPKTIDSYATSESVNVYVYQEEEDHEPTALLCGEMSGSLYQIWGARTHPDHRGKGIMKRMMSYIETMATSQSNSLTHMVSTTVKDNESMLKLFDKQGYQHHATVYGWPYNGTPYLLKEEVSMSTSEEIGWTRCTSVDELTEALCVLRDGSPPDIHSLWIPASYEVVSSDGPLVKELLDSSIGHGHIFIGKEADKYCGVIARIQSQLGSPIASIVYNQPSMALPMLSAACHVVPDLTRVYIDTCHSGHPVHHTKASSLETGWYEYMVLTKSIPNIK